MILETGKLDSDVLKKLVFDKIKYRNDDVKIRPGIGEDCTVIDFGEYDCVMSTDPITSSVSDIGRLSIHITCNDIASNGVEPLGIMLAVMLPEGTTDSDVSFIMQQAAETAAGLNVEIIGGHTEITPAVNRPVIVSTAIGKTVSDGSESGSAMQPGDIIMMTKSAGLEGCGIIAADYRERLERILSKDDIDKAVSFLDTVSVVREGVAAGKVGTHGMHDITEGGILGAVWEMCQISGTGVEVWTDMIPLEDVTRRICEIFDINPYRLISSGSMVIVVSPDRQKAMERAMKKAGVEITAIGRVREKEYGMMMFEHEGGEASQEIVPPYADEIYKVVGREV